MSVVSASPLPIRKVATGGIAAAVVTIGVWLLEQFFHVDVPTNVATSIVTVVSFAAAYLIPPSPGDVPVNAE